MVLEKVIQAYRTVPASEPIEDSARVRGQYRYWRLRMFYGMWVGYVVYYLTRKNISPVLHVFSQELGISLMDLGILGSVFYGTYGLGKFASGVLADRADIRLFMATGLLGSSIVNLVFPYIGSLWVLAFFWGLNGAFQSMGFPPVAKGLVHWFSTSERATKWTVWSSSHTAGTFLVGILVAFVLKYAGWRAAFTVPGAIGVLTSVFLLNRLRDRPVSLGLPPVEEFRNDPLPVKKDAGHTHWQLLKAHVFTSPYIWALCLAYVFVYLIRFGTLDWATKFMYDVRGIDKVRVAFMWSLMPLFGMPGGIVAGWAADRFFQGRCAPINLIYLVLLSGSIWGFYRYAGMDHFALTCFFLAAIGFFVDGPQNLVGGVQVSRIVAQEATSAAVGFAGLFGYIGAMISGVGLAWVTGRFGWAGMYATCVASSVIAGALVALTWKREQVNHRNEPSALPAAQPGLTTAKTSTKAASAV